jgi:hypothetical protein
MGLFLILMAGSWLGVVVVAVSLGIKKRLTKGAIND